MYNADQQIFNEYISVAAPTIQTSFYDFNFSHVAAFLDSLSEDNIKTFPTLDNDSKSRFIIKLEITDDCSTNPPRLSQWLARFAQGSKGSGIKFEYGISELYESRLLDVALFRPLLLRFITYQLLEAKCFEFRAEACWFGRSLVDSYAHLSAHRRKILGNINRMPRLVKGRVGAELYVKYVTDREQRRVLENRDYYYFQ
jgi:hypothetical protein